jgi:hypothetical protein
MRLYAISKNRFGHPYVEAVVTQRFMIEDYQSNLYTREQLEADDLLRFALERLGRRQRPRRSPSRRRGGP